MSTQAFTLPVRLESTANKREHHMARHRRAKGEREAAYLKCMWHEVPCTVTITRIAPRALDSDNNVIAAKSVRDGIADRLGVKDNDPRILWLYDQRKGAPKEYAVHVKLWADDPF